MPTKQNNWEEDFKKLTNYLNSDYGVEEYKQFIKDLRKKDEEELIKSLGEQYGGEHFMSVIKDYYNLTK